SARAAGISSGGAETPIVFQLSDTTAAAVLLPCGLIRISVTNRSPLELASTPSDPLVQPAWVSSCWARYRSYGYFAIDDSSSARAGSLGLIQLSAAGPRPPVATSLMPVLSRE